MAWELGTVLNALGAALIAGLGLAVLAIRPRLRANIFFGLFAIAFGGQFVITNVALAMGAASGGWYEGSRFVLRVAAIVGAVGVGLLFPRRLVRAERPSLVVALGVAAALLAAFWVLVWSDQGHWDLLFEANSWASGAFDVMIVSLFFLLFLFAGRYAQSHDRAARAQFRLMSAALVVYVGIVAGAGPASGLENTVFSTDARIVLFSGFLLALMALLAVMWLWNSARSPAPAADRNVALLALLVPLLGMLQALFAPEFGIYGIARIVAMAVLTYAIVRHQLLGIDLKVRWGISKGTIAGLFIAVFFVVSELGKAYFEGVVDNHFLGIFAAGLLVFAISPLHRLADQVAARAVPLTAAAPTGGDPALTRTQVYRNAVRWALRDREVTREEELQLMQLADELRLPARRALEIRYEVEHALDVGK